MKLDDIQLMTSKLEPVEDTPEPTVKMVQKPYLDLWYEIVDFLKANIELTDDREYHVLTGWIVSSYFADLWITYPYLFFRGIYKSGKTRAQETVMLVTPQSQSATNMSVPALFRILGLESKKGKQVVRHFCTFYIDELALSGKLDDEKRRALLQILNAGYKKGAVVKRCVHIQKQIIVKDFRVDGFKCLASIFPLPDTLRSRCLTIRMRKTRRRFPMRIEASKAEDLKKDLYEVREEVISEFQKGNNMLEITDAMEEFLFENAGRDGRLVEIYSPIYMVAPEKVKPLMVEYLRDLGQAELQEELASFEAEVFIALLKLYNEQNEPQIWFATRDVVQIFNEGKGDREKVKTRTISRHIKSLGFKPYRTRGKRGYKWDEKLIEKLKERYPVELTDVTEVTLQQGCISKYFGDKTYTPTEPSEASQPSPKLDDDEKCSKR